MAVSESNKRGTKAFSQRCPMPQVVEKASDNAIEAREGKTSEAPE